MERIVKLIDYGYENLTARVIGIKIRTDIEKMLSDNDVTKIIFDFDQINLISTGFAKELFGYLYQSYQDQFFQKFGFQISKHQGIIQTLIKKALYSMKKD